MTILVTGGAGYIGSHMVHTVVESGESVVVLDNLSTGFKWAVPRGVALVIGETGDDALVSRLIAEREVSAIIHFAASIVVPDSMSDPLGYYRNNTVNSRALIECAVRAGVKQFVFSSTAAVYGNPAKVPISEDDAVAPMSPYGSSKLMTEIMLRDAGMAHGLDYVILRYFNVAGADPSLRTGQSTRGATHLIKVAVETALGKRSHFQVMGSDYRTRDGSCIRDFVHVSDLADAHTRAVEHLLSGGDSLALNLGTGQGTTVKELLSAIQRVSGRNFRVEYGQRRDGDSPALVADNALAKHIIDWSPRYDLESIIRTAWYWHARVASA